MSPSNLSIKTKTMSTMKTKKPKNTMMSYKIPKTRKHKLEKLLFPWHDMCSRPLEKPIITHTKLTKELDNLKSRLENVHHTNARHNVHRIEDLGLS